VGIDTSPASSSRLRARTRYTTRRTSCSRARRSCFSHTWHRNRSTAPNRHVACGSCRPNASTRTGRDDRQDGRAILVSTACRPRLQATQFAYPDE